MNKRLLVGYSLLACHGAMACDLTVHVQPGMPEGRVEVIWLNVTHGFISALRAAPVGWRFTVDNDPSWITAAMGIAIVGAADLERDQLSTLFSIPPEHGVSCQSLIESGDISMMVSIGKFNDMKSRRYRIDRSALELRD